MNTIQTQVNLLKLRELRIKANISREEMRILLGFKHVSSISAIENGDNRIYADDLKKWAKICHVTTDELYK